MDAITAFFAALFAKFRVNNPLLASIVLLVLSAVTVTAINGQVLGLFKIEGVLQQVIQYVSLFLTAVVGGGQVAEKR